MSRWQYTKGLHDLGSGCHAWLQPDGGWGYSNAGLVSDAGEALLVDTLFDLAHTQEMLDGFRGWLDEERMVVNVHALYREFSDGRAAPVAPDELHARMRRWRERRANKDRSR